MKKLIIVTGAILLAASLMVGPRTMGSHLSHLFGMARESVQNAEPLEYQIDRLESTLENFGPKIEEANQELAKGQVEVRYLEQDIARLRQEQSSQETRIKVQLDRLKGAVQASYTIAGKRYDRAHLESALGADFARFKQKQALLSSKEKQLDAQRAAVDAARQRLETAMNDRLVLKTKVAELRARLTQIKAQEAVKQKFELDDGALAEAHELAERITKRLDVAQQMIDNEVGPGLEPEVDLGEEHGTSIADEVDAYFGIESNSSKMNVSEESGR